MIGVYNHLLRKVFRFHYHSQKVIGSLGKVLPIIPRLSWVSPVLLLASPCFGPTGRRPPWRWQWFLHINCCQIWLATQKQTGKKETSMHYLDILRLWWLEFSQLELEPTKISPSTYLPSSTKIDVTYKNHARKPNS